MHSLAKSLQIQPNGDLEGELNYSMRKTAFKVTNFPLRAFSVITLCFQCNRLAFPVKSQGIFSVIASHFQ